MTQTLRRELRLKFEEILHRGALWTKEKLADELADAALEVSAVSKRADIASQNPEWAILGGMEVSQDSLDRERTEREAVNAFESAFGITRPWDWWVADKDWRDLRAFVVEQFRADSECFNRYVAWSRTPYVKGAMTSLSIKRNPELFRDSWDVFKVQDKLQVKSLEDLGWK